MNSHPKAAFIGIPLLEYDTLDSTNLFAQELVSKSNPNEGTVVLAHHQTAGKGQYGRKWEAQGFSNLTLSIILHPTFLEPRRQFYLHFVSSLAIADLIESYIDQPVYIKWPNDIYVRDLKICGILIQNNLQGQTIAQSIIGIGLNVNQKTFSKDLPNPTSLSLASKREYDLKDTRVKLFNAFEYYYLKLRNGHLKELENQYQERLYSKGQLRKFIIGKEQISGTIQSVNGDGELVIQTNGLLKSYNNTEIQYLR